MATRELKRQKRTERVKNMRGVRTGRVCLEAGVGDGGLVDQSVPRITSLIVSGHERFVARRTAAMVCTACRR